MIERIVLHNFQKHENLAVSFTDGFNLITGCNGWGKSAILRAIQWVTVNEGDSKAFRRTYLDNMGNLKTSNETWVELYIDGHVIKRVYSTSKNEYYLDGVKLTGFGRSVPNEIKNICRMESFNFSEQFAPLFLIGDSSGSSVVKELGEITSLEEMEQLTNAVNSDVRKYKEKIDETSGSLEQMRSDASIFDSYTSIFDEIDADVKLYVDDDSNDSTRVSEVLKAVEKIRFINDNKVDCEKELTSIEHTITTDDFTSVDLSGVQSCIDSLTRTDSLVADGCLSELPDTLSIDDFKEDTKVTELLSIITEINKYSSSLVSVENDLKEVYTALSEFKVCPLCERELEECTHE